MLELIPIGGKPLEWHKKARFPEDQLASCVKNRLPAGEAFGSYYESRSKAIGT